MQRKRDDIEVSSSLVQLQTGDGGLESNWKCSCVALVQRFRLLNKQLSLLLLTLWFLFFIITATLTAAAAAAAAEGKLVAFGL